MVAKLVLLSVLIAIVVIINTATAESNESISSAAFGYELTITGLDDINFNMQQSHVRSREYYQALSSDIESLKRTVQAVETLITTQVRHIGTLEEEIKELVNLVKSEARNPYLRNEMELLAFNVSRLLKDSSDIYRVQQKIPTTTVLNDFILQLLAGKNTSGIKPSHFLPETKILPQTCTEISHRRSGLYRIQPQQGFSDAFEVYCDQEYENGGWLIIQNRYDGSVNFFRSWQEYEAGFGDLRGEFWLGLKKIHELTYIKPHKLHIIMEDLDGKIVTAQYDRFVVGGPETKYTLSSLGNYTGTAGDSLNEHLRMKFSTFDNDNDISNEDCAVNEVFGWWYKDCGYSNLNGPYLKGPQPSGVDTMYWYAFHGFYYGVKRSRMLLREVDNI